MTFFRLVLLLFLSSRCFSLLHLNFRGHCACKIPFFLVRARWGKLEVVSARAVFFSFCPFFVSRESFKCTAQEAGAVLEGLS